MIHGYKINKGKKVTEKRYKREELDEMTTFQLKNICLKQKIVKGLINNLDREGFIETILRYRGFEDSLLINSEEEGGFQRISEILKNKRALEKYENKIDINIPAKIVSYKGVGLKKEDDYKVITSSSLLKQSNVLIVNEDFDLCGILNIEKDKEDNNYFYMTSNKNIQLNEYRNKSYNLLFFLESSSEEIFKLYYSKDYTLKKQLSYIVISAKDIQIRELHSTDTVLAIDFGTTNTSAGVYLSNNYIDNISERDVANKKIKLNEINYVRFLNEDKNNYVEVIPTLVYIKDCSNFDSIKYKFGYDAQRLIKSSNYTCSASFFQGIKRWVNSYKNLEEIFDESGNVTCISKGEIIKKYIEYIVQCAEHQFKCKFKNLHISTPVKLKDQYLQMFQEILPSYSIERKNSLDEGVSVLYNTIATQIERNSFEHGEEYKALIIDCGGGTTDLSSCEFVIEEGQLSFKVYIGTTYENGDTNFGGNNITYRIMQFMKIIFAYYYKNQVYDIDIDKLIDIPSSEIFSYVDDIGRDKIYKKLEEEYKNAEGIIPTKFKEYESRSLEEYKIVKNNFYFLWEIAEQMKKEFFKKTGILRNKFDSTKEEQKGDLKITEISRWNISILENDEFVGKYEFPNVVFNIEEISKLIKADIYEITRKFLDDFYYSGVLQEYSIIKLTGQSCRIDIFREALKEFVPGKTIEFKKKKSEDEKVSELKLSCVRGALKYLNSRKIGDVQVTITSNEAISPYAITSLEYNKNEKVIIECKENLKKLGGYISRPIEAQEIEFYLKDDMNNIKQTYTYKNNIDDYEYITPEKILEKYENKILQDDTDTIINEEVRFFIFSNNTIWGFCVLPILRRNDQLYIGKEVYFPFENDLSEKDFFDGTN